MKKPALNNHPVHPLIRERWSPRAFSAVPAQEEVTNPETPSVPEAIPSWPTIIASLLEAARWAPSAMNEQPWRFLVGFSGDETWQGLFDNLTGWNQKWAQSAPVLILVIGKETYSSNGKPNDWSAYDAGQAAAHLTLEATSRGLFVHQMGGFRKPEVIGRFNLPQEYAPLSILAIGFYGDPSTLPEELQLREKAQRERKPLSELVFSESFGQPVNWL